MTFLHRAGILLAMSAALILALPAGGSAQQGPAFTLEQVERLVRAKVPGIINDLRRDCIAFEVTDDVATRLKAAGADDAFLVELRTVCKRLPQAETPPARAQPPAPAPVRQTATPRTAVSPGSAAIRSLFIPGLGQFATGKPAAGVAFLAAWGGALGYGLLSKETTTECLARVQPGSTCPANDIRGTSVKRPSLAIGVGGALAVAVVSALHARSAASHLRDERGCESTPRARARPARRRWERDGPAGANPVLTTQSREGPVMNCVRAATTILVTGIAGALAASCNSDVLKVIDVAVVEIQGLPGELQAGSSAQVTAIPKDDRGNRLTGREVAWSSSNPGVASVSGNGLLTALTAGNTTITASSEGKSASGMVNVTPVPVASVIINPPAATLDIGVDVQLVATARSASGATLTGRPFTWETSDVSIASVTQAGVVTAHGIGTATITASAEGKVGASTITVIATKVAFAYAYANQSTTSTYTPAGINLAGGMMTVTRTAVGTYTVAFGGLGVGTGGFGNAFTAIVDGNSAFFLANLTAPTALCNLSQLNANQPLTATVHCEDPVTGLDTDSRFRVLVVGDDALGGSGAPGRQSAFSGHTNTAQAVGVPYTPNPVFSWNSGGSPMSITWQGGGLITHNHGIAIQNPGQGRLATGFGPGVVCYPLSRTVATETTVRCLNRSGPVNAVHTLMTAFQGRPGHAAGYTYVDPNVGVSISGSYNSGGGPIGFQKVGIGKYQITFEGMSFTGQIGIATSIQGAAAWFACNHFLAGSDPVIIEVACFNEFGNFADPEPAFSVFVVE